MSRHHQGAERRRATFYTGRNPDGLLEQVRNGQAPAAAPSPTSGDAETHALLKSLGM